MKKKHIAYWVITVIFVAFMMFTAIPDIMVMPDAVTMVSQGLGYPQYIIPFLVIAKLLGAIAVLVPRFPRLKEWAYAGLFFDLAGATYSMLATSGFQPMMLFMILPFGFLFWSYFLWHKKRETDLTQTGMSH